MPRPTRAPTIPGLLSIALLAACGGEPTRAAPPAVAQRPSSAATAAAGSSTAATTDASSRPPPTAKQPVTDVLFGTKIVDDYRWLEDGKDPAVKAWSDAQNVWARRHLDGIAQRPALAARVRQLLESASPDYFGLTAKGKQLFTLELQPPKQQPFLVVLGSSEDPKGARTLVDPNALDPKGGTTIDWFVPSHDGKLVAVSLSQGGSESGTVHVYEVATGKEREADAVPRAHGGTAGGSLAWAKDGVGFWYTRYPHEGERPKQDVDFFQQVWFHRLGTPSSDDRYVLGGSFPRIAEIELQTSEDGRFVLARVANGDGGEYQHWLASAADATPPKDPPLEMKFTGPLAKKEPPTGVDARFVKVADYADKVVRSQLGRDGNLWLLSRKGAPKGTLLAVSPAVALDGKGLGKARVVVPESDAVIERFVVTRSRAYVVDLVGGPSQVRVFDGKGKALGTVPLLPISAVQDLAPLDGDDVLVRNVSYVEPAGWYRYAAKTGAVTKTALVERYAADVVDYSDVEVLRDTCASKDGTRVPINVLRRKGTQLDGGNPTMLYAYGGYGVSMTPRFRPQDHLWLEQGGVLAIANLRGGGEFGEAWHLAGNLTQKQHVFDDFLGCARWLVDQKYTRPGALAIRGGSNGGLLMGAALTQAPDLFSVVISHVGIYDMLRVEKTPNGAFNVTEFGTVEDKAQFEALYAYSPYHRVKDGTAYPAVLMLTGANDPRVDPYNSRKMIARLQAATSGSRPILLRTSGDTGHGMGTPLGEWIDEETDVYSFLFEQLGHPYAPRAAAK